MSNSRRISIRTKILTLLSAVVILAVAFYLFLASRIFLEDKTLLIYELNQSLVRTLGAETESQVASWRSRLDALVRLPAESRELIGGGEDFLRAGLLRSDGTEERFGFWLREGAAKSQGVSDADARAWLEGLSLGFVPRDQVSANGLWVGGVDGAPVIPSFVLAIPVREGSEERASAVAYAVLPLERLAAGFGARGIARPTLLDSRSRWLAGAPLTEAEAPLAALLSEMKVRSEVRRVPGPGGESGVLAAFYRLDDGGLSVLARVDESEAFSATRVLVRRSLVYAGVVVTAAFLIALFFSHGLTAPIAKLADATQEIARGNFDQQIEIRSRDELADLAGSFNSMTSDLKNARESLVRSERMAAVGQVARAIGHEFGNLLQTILGKADLALQDTDAAKVKERLNLIIQASEKASLIVRNLQSFSKGSAALAPVDLSQVARTTLTLVSHELKKSNVRLVERFSATRSVTANSGELEQVLMNLVINATHAMPQGGELEVGTEDTALGAAFWVKDTGVGIPPEILSRIFEYAYTTKGDKGSGLGLSISQEIVRKHGGTIEVESSVGKGTRFRVEIPFQTA